MRAIHEGIREQQARQELPRGAEQTVRSWSAVSPAEKVQREWRDSAEAKAWRKGEREQKKKTDRDNETEMSERKKVVTVRQ